MRYPIFLFFLTIGTWLFGQAPHPPMELPPLLSGTFGELRSNHFHAGIDIKTGGKEGQPVRAVWSGHVSRIAVSPYGYGHALYIDHPNGKTTVYAHLQRFSTEIQAYLRELQYERKSFSVDVQVAPGRLPVAQDELIGLSGNSGGSGGPHLHFEIRKSSNQHPLNPLLEGIEKEDHIAPVIQGVRLVSINERWEVVEEKDLQANNRYQVANRVGIEVRTFDQLDGASNRNGIFSIELLVDSQMVYRFAVDELSFDEKRYINAHANYAEKACCNAWWQRMYQLPGNRLRNVDARINDGVIALDSGEVANVWVLVNDVAGNQKQFPFQLQGNGQRVAPPSGDWLSHRQDHQIAFGELKAYLPHGVLYKDERMVGKTLPSVSGIYGSVYQLLSDSVPAHEYYSLQLPLEAVPLKYRSKSLVVSINRSGKWSSEGGKVDGDVIKVRVRQFGKFGVAIDTIAPHIRTIGFQSGADLSKADGIELRASDNLSGIEDYRAEIDGKWHLLEYDYKTARFYLPFEGRIGTGTHQLVFSVTDGVGNRSELRASFVR